MYTWVKNCRNMYVKMCIMYNSIDNILKKYLQIENPDRDYLNFYTHIIYIYSKNGSK